MSYSLKKKQHNWRASRKRGNNACEYFLNIRWSVYSQTKTRKDSARDNRRSERSERRTKGQKSKEEQRI